MREVNIFTKPIVYDAKSLLTSSMEIRLDCKTATAEKVNTVKVYSLADIPADFLKPRLEQILIEWAVFQATPKVKDGDLIRS